MGTFSNVAIVGVFADNGVFGPQVLWREAPGGSGFLGWAPVYPGTDIQVSTMMAVAIAAYSTGKLVEIHINSSLQLDSISLIG